MIKKAQLPDIW